MELERPILLFIALILLLIAWVFLPWWWKRKRKDLLKKNPEEVTLYDLYIGILELRSELRSNILELRSTIWQAILTAIAIIIGLLALIG